MEKKFYRITYTADTTYYVDTDLYTPEQALYLADDWFAEFVPNVTIEIVKEEEVE